MDHFVQAQIKVPSTNYIVNSYPNIFYFIKINNVAETNLTAKIRHFLNVLLETASPKILPLQT